MRTQYLRKFLGWVDTHAGTSLATEVPRLRQPAPRSRIATAEERARLLSAAPLWFRAFLMLCIDLALRHGEAARACAADYDPEHRILTVNRKHDNISRIPVSDELHQLFLVAMKRDDTRTPLHVVLGGRVTNFNLKDWWYKTKKKANVSDDLRIHDLRRTTATALYLHTKDLRAVQQLLGHRSLHATAGYLAPHDPAVLAKMLAELRMPTEKTQ